MKRRQSFASDLFRAINFKLVAFFVFVMDVVSAPGSIIDHRLVWLCVVVPALTHNHTNPMLRNAGAEAKTAHYSLNKATPF
jgi:hypothetical protein